MNQFTTNRVLFVLYPGSGETYLTYCIESFFNLQIKTINKEESEKGDSIFLKTTCETSANIDYNDCCIIYLVRDGRNAVVSQVFSSINSNKHSIEALDQLIEEATIAQDGSYFNGWSNHINHWLQKATFVVKFEDLIQNPVFLMRVIATQVNLPYNSLVKLKKYNEKEFGDYVPLTFTNNNKVIVPEDWSNYFSKARQELFYKLHYSNLIKFEYEEAPEISPLVREYVFDGLYRKNIYKGFSKVESEEKLTILFDATKLLMPHNDGIKRYVLELLKAYQEIIPLSNRIHLDVFDGGKIYNIKEIALESYWYIIPIKDPFLKLVKDAVIKQIKNILKSVLSKESFTNLSLKYKQFKSTVKGVIINSLLKNKHNKENIDYIFSNAVYEKYNMVHIPLLQDVDFINFFKSKSLITIHDLTHITHPEFHTIDNIRIADNGLKAAIRHNADFISISEYTQQDIIKHGITTDKAPYIYEAADVNKFFPYNSKYWSDEIRTKYNIPKNVRFYLSLSTLEPRKNLKNAIIAFQECVSDLPDDFYFVIAGKQGWNLENVIPKSIDKNSKIIFTGFVHEDDLAWLYREAYALVYVSHYEGFGLPLLEAMSCAKPVIYGNNSSMTEIAKDAGIAVNTKDIKSISNAMINIANNKDLYLAKSELAFGISNQFNWFKTGLLTLNHYIEKVQEKDSELCINTDIYY